MNIKIIIIHHISNRCCKTYTFLRTKMQSKPTIMSPCVG